MPCDDTAAQIIVTIDNDDRLISYDYRKMTCGRRVGYKASAYHDMCRGKRLDEILNIRFEDVIIQLELTEQEDQFFHYLEWEALRTGLAQYSGNESDIDLSRCEIASVDYDGATAIIRQIIEPPKDMGKVESCAATALMEIARKDQKTAKI